MKKILVGFIMDGHGGGVDNYLLNFLRNTASSEARIDFLTNEIDGELRRYLNQYHSRLFAIANLKRPVKQFRQVCKILEKGQYDAVYLNVSTAIDCVAAWAARHKKVKRILIHSHSSGNDCENTGKRLIFNTIHVICRLFLYRAGTEYYGCSKKAGLWLFPRKIVESERFQTIFNAVNLEKCRYAPQVRRQVRKELNLENKFVIGNVGNFTYPKNHYFIIDIFEKLKEKRKDAVLVLAGDGLRMKTVKKQIEEKGLKDSVRLLGFRKDVDRILQGIDFFLLPSYFEGLPTVGVEAQCAGLPCLMSKNVTDEARITEDCWFLPLNAGAEAWADFILSHGKKDREATAWIGQKESYSLEELKKQQLELVNR